LPLFKNAAMYRFNGFLFLFMSITCNIGAPMTNKLILSGIKQTQKKRNQEQSLEAM
jgi:hypothetical protein